MRKSTKLGGVRYRRPAPIEKSVFKPIEEGLRTELLAVQYELRDAKFPVVILLAGDDRDSVIEVTSRFTEWLDARLLDIVLRDSTTDDERERPYFWRFATRMPQNGRIGVFPFAWAHDALLARIDSKFAKKHHVPSMSDIAEFEKHLTDAGVLLLKFWFHLENDELRAKRKRDDHDPLASWDPDPSAAKRWRKLEHGDGDEAALVRATHRPAAPWHIIHSADDEARDLEVGRILRDSLRSRLATPFTPPRVTLNRIAIPDRIGALSAAIRSKKVPTDADERIQELQGRLNGLARKAHRHGHSTVLVFEGQDAAGKGGAIRRVTRGIRAPVYTVVPIAAPTPEEKAHHYLWRFWRELPRAGRFTIFDRSWYGRVLVERVEGFASENEWKRAYEEIVSFERALVNRGVRLVKFWLDVSEEEQLRRFDARGKVPFKKYKLTPDDYRNRAKRPQYRDAANDMFARTDARGARWHLIQGDDKNAARIAVLETLCHTL